MAVTSWVLRVPRVTSEPSDQTVKPRDRLENVKQARPVVGPGRCHRGELGRACDNWAWPAAPGGRVGERPWAAVAVRLRLLRSESGERLEPL